MYMSKSKNLWLRKWIWKTTFSSQWQWFFKRGYQTSQSNRANIYHWIRSGGLTSLVNAFWRGQWGPLISFNMQLIWYVILQQEHALKELQFTCQGIHLCLAVVLNNVQVSHVSAKRGAESESCCRRNSVPKQALRPLCQHLKRIKMSILGYLISHGMTQFTNGKSDYVERG